MFSSKLKAVTQSDVATLVGVSQRTVSRCFLQPNAVSPEICARILEVARRKGYHPNRAARIIRGGRSESVTLLRDAGAPDGYVHTSFLWSIHQCLGEHRLHLAFGDLPLEPHNSGEPVLPPSDGVVVPCHSGLSEEAGGFARRLPMPVVWVNTMGVGDCVCPDDRRAGHDATESLLRLGHRRIAFVDQPGVGTTATPRYCNYGARLEGYRTAMKAAGLKPWLLCVDKGETPDAMLKAFRCILASSERPTGLVICRKHDAQAAIFASYTCPGLQVPRDLSMVTFTDELPGMAPVVTAWVTPWKIMGRVSIETLMARMRAPEADSVLKFIPMEMAPGTTCDKPPVS